MAKIVRLLALCLFWFLGTAAALACKCDPISPQAGYDRAQYVFTGKIVSSGDHAWVVAIDRIWKGREKLAASIKLMDIFNKTDCEFFFEPGKSYLFFTIIAKSGKKLFYHPLACSWTRPLQSTRFVGPDNQSRWIEDYIAQTYGPGEPPLQ